MHSLKILIVVAALVVFSAGAVVGRIVRLPGLPGLPGLSPATVENRPNAANADGSRLAEELHLTPEQGRQMYAFYDDAIKKAGPPPIDEIGRAERERRDGLMMILTKEQKEQYDAVEKRYKERMDRLQAKFGSPFREAEDRTRAILTPAQREKYDEFLKSRPRGGTLVPITTTPPPATSE